jgi:CBS domain-containing protein
MAMRAAEVMTRTVITVDPDAQITEAIRLMLQHKISGLPVVDKGGKLVGILTEGDLLRRAETGTQRRRPRWLEYLVGPGKLAADYVHTHARKVSELMTTEVQTVDEDAPLDQIVELMERHRIKRVPVVKAGKLVGLVSRANLLRALASLSREAKPAAAGDLAIRERLLAELEKQPWAPTALTDITVRNGVVELWGVITDDRQRQALKVAAENIAGVKEVKDHLVWVEPMTGTVIGAEGEVQARAL